MLKWRFFKFYFQLHLNFTLLYISYLCPFLHIFFKTCQHSSKNNKARSLDKLETSTWLAMTGQRCNLLQTAGLERFWDSEHIVSIRAFCPCLAPFCHILLMEWATKCYNLSCCFLCLQSVILKAETIMIVNLNADGIHNRVCH